MIEQGCMSKVEIIGNRLIKHINKVNIEGYIVPLYEEYKILKYVQNLGLEFPQNVKCEGPLSLSYDYKPGLCLETYLSKHTISIEMQKNLGLQLILIYKKLIDKGIIHEDYNYRNFIIDEDLKIHSIDFGIVEVDGRNKIGIDQRNLPKDVNFNDYPEPKEDYREVDLDLTFRCKFDRIYYMVKYNLCREQGIIKDPELSKKLIKSTSFEEFVSILS